jgi:hypothetical protein
METPRKQLNKYFSFARSRDFDGKLGTELPVSMYATKSPIDMCHFNFRPHDEVGNTDVMFVEIKSTARLRSRDRQTSTLSHALCSSLTDINYIILFASKTSMQRHLLLYN